MVEFGKTLAKSKRPQWADYYLNYDKLKSILQQAKEERTKQQQCRQHHRRTSSFSIIFGNDHGTTSDPNNNSNNTTDSETTNTMYLKHQSLLLEFRRTLDLEIEKVVLFSLEEQGRLSQQLQTLHRQREACLDYIATIWQDYHNHNGLLIMESSPKYSLIRDTHQAYQQIAYQVLEYVQFVDLNVTAVRKILKKHDKNHSSPISPQYLNRLGTTTTAGVDSHLDHLYQFGGLTALIATLHRAFAELHQVECFMMVLSDSEKYLSLIGTSTIPTVPSTTTTTRSSFRASWSAPILSPGPALTASISASTSITNANSLSMVTTTMSQEWDSDPSKVLIPLPPITSSPSSKQQPHVIYARLINTWKLPTRYTLAREPLLDQIHAARSRLQQSTKYVELVAAQSLFFEDVEEDDLSTSRPIDRPPPNNISSMLNLASTFLYMTNYYIVAPTTGNYAIKLGSSEAMAGIIIGMTPNAALVATILYAWWSNHSYKSALLFAAACSLAGNVAYALALNFHSLELVMVGRFLNGFGSARSINRRFIADTFSREDRTAASAAFVTAAALGMAAGPAIATALAQVESNSVWWTEETAPGWVMMVAWLVFFLVALLYFEEPDRSHIFGKAASRTTTTTATPSETQPLLDDRAASQPLVLPPAPRKSPWFGNVPVMITLWIYFVLKLVLECLLSSCGIVTRFYFGWDSQQSAAFLAFLGILMFPANMGVARLSQVYEDRELIRGTLVVMLISVLGIFVYHPAYSHVQYVVFGICIFLSTNVLEGPNMSLLSKTVPKQWARGIFNSGFLATEAGTAARSVGDVLISAVAFRGVENLLNSTFLPLLLLVLLSIMWTMYYFEHLVEDDDDESSLPTQPSTIVNSKGIASQVSTDTLESNKSFGNVKTSTVSMESNVSKSWNDGGSSIE